LARLALEAWQPEPLTHANQRKTPMAAKTTNTLLFIFRDWLCVCMCVCAPIGTGLKLIGRQQEHIFLENGQKLNTGNFINFYLLTITFHPL
jgi:hypothetical protein